MKIKAEAIIFDMDGVITNTMPDHFCAWKIIFRQDGIRVSHLDVYKREGQRGINSVKEIFKEHHLPLEKRKAREILARKEELFKKIVKVRFISGARRFLKFLHRNDFKLALVTGTARHEVRKILPDGIYNLFDVVVTGSDVRFGKPHPEPFLKAVKKLKVKPGAAVVIENAPFGIRSAKAAGLKCLAVATSLPGRYLHDADAIFSSIHDLQGKVRFLKD